MRTKCRERALWRCDHEMVDDSEPGRLVAREPVIGTVNCDMILVDKIGGRRDAATGTGCREARS